MIYEIDTTQLSPERKGRITASRAMDVMAKGRGQMFGKTALGYAQELALERLGVELHDFTSLAMQQGLDREPDARQIYINSRQVHVKPPGFIKHKDYDFIGCTPDGVIEGGGLLEIKCPEHKAHFDYLLNGITDKYYYQVQFQMMVTSAEWCDFMTFNPDFPTKLIAKVWRIRTDIDYQAELLERCIELNKIVNEILEKL
jgi:hypothetical protein